MGRGKQSNNGPLGKVAATGRRVPSTASLSIVALMRNSGALEQWGTSGHDAAAWTCVRGSHLSFA